MTTTLKSLTAGQAFRLGSEPTVYVAERVASAGGQTVVTALVTGTTISTRFTRASLTTVTVL